MATPVTITNLNQSGRLEAREANASQVLLSYNADFSGAADLTFDFSLAAQQLKFGAVRSLFCDNSTNPAEVVVLVYGTNTRFTCPAFSEGYYKVDALENSRIQVTTTGGASGPVNFVFYNYTVAPNVWYRYGAQNLSVAILVNGPNPSGSVVATNPNNNPLYIAGLGSDGNLHPFATDSNGALIVAPTRGVYTKRSGVIAVANTSQLLMPASLLRKRIFIQNPTSAAAQGVAAAESIFVNYTVAAGVNDGDSTEIFAGGSIDFNLPVTTEAVYIVAATVGHKFIAKEMF
jgi:hypothetical protein